MCLTHIMAHYCSRHKMDLPIETFRVTGNCVTDRCNTCLEKDHAQLEATCTERATALVDALRSAISMSCAPSWWSKRKRSILHIQLYSILRSPLISIFLTLVTMLRSLTQQPKMARRNSNPQPIPLERSSGSFSDIVGSVYNIFLNQQLQAGVSGLTKSISFHYNCAQERKNQSKSMTLRSTMIDTQSCLFNLKFT